MCRTFLTSRVIEEASRMFACQRDEMANLFPVIVNFIHLTKLKKIPKQENQKRKNQTTISNKTFDLHRPS